MLYGFYSAASGMLLNQKNLGVSANNMANIKTAGFKSDKIVMTAFEREMLVRVENGKRTEIGSSTPMSYAYALNTNFDPSLLKTTDRVFDMAINGEGYFNIQAGNQRLLTRNGAFDVDENGYLVLPGVGQVLGENGPLRVLGSNFVVLSNGSVYDEDGNDIGRILITQPNEQQLEKLDNGMYTMQNYNAQTQLVGATINQFMLEANNVDLNKEFASVMEYQRAFEACSRALKNIDQINSKTVLEIAKI